jgi:polar amino acid transport system substrate-binding protein
MKNKTKILLVAIVAITMIGCGGAKTAKINTLSDLKGKVIGGIAQGTTVKNYEKMIYNLIGAEPKEVIFYKRGMDAYTALINGKIDAFPTMNFSAEYGLKRYSNLKMIAVQGKIEGGVIMAVRTEDQWLKDELDKAITTLQDNGTLKSLADTWITNLPVTNEPANKMLPKIEGAKTVYVGVSGDFIPLDYIAADGRPAGYNVAILSEIGKLININFELISIEAESKFAALFSKKIDVIFYHLQSSNTNYFDEFKNANWISTKPYYNYNGGCFVVLK